MITYEYYVGQYHGGSISPTDWPAVEREAAATLARYKRLYDVSGDEEAESMAICAMAETLYAKAAGLTSVSIGSVSESYQQTESNSVYQAASLYLTIYRGVR